MQGLMWKSVTANYQMPKQEGTLGHVIHASHFTNEKSKLGELAFLKVKFT